MARLVKRGHRHHFGWGEHGEVVECDCGRRFKFREYPNTAYSGWVQTWPSVFGLHPRPKPTSQEDSGDGSG